MCVATLTTASAEIKPMGLVSEGAIFQRHAPIPIWGWAAPGESITVTLAEASATAVADESGKWSLKLPEMEAALDLSMTIQGDQTEQAIELHDIAVGEVWLASGQSNMQWQVKSVDMSELADLPPNPMIREGRAIGDGGFREPNVKSRGTWIMDTPENRPNFSAVAYYFAKKLQAELDVPVGFITAAVGGTAVEPWTPREVVDSVRPVWSKEYWDAYDQHPELVKAFLEASKEWLEVYQRVDTRKAVDPKAHLTPSTEQPWTTVDLYKEFPDGLYSGYGVLWLRKMVDVEAGQFDGKSTYLRLYTKDSYPDIYLNGKMIQDTTIENHPGKGVWINCRIEACTLQAGANEIMLRIYSPFVALDFDRAYSIDGLRLDSKWEARVEVDFGVADEAALASMPAIPERRVGFGRLPAVHFNRFIAPIAGYGLRGAIWYQGETNAQQHEVEEYAKMFPAMIESWRELWGQPDMSFYYCQLAAYGGKTKDPANVGWAPFRAAQEAALKLPHTGQAVLIDVGESDIHPYDKASVGDRLARLALARDYGREIVDSGPVFKSLKLLESGEVRVEFEKLADGLIAAPIADTYPRSKKQGNCLPLERYVPDSELEGFALQDAAGKWHWAHAKINGESVMVSTAGIERPVAIRYNWQNFPNGNLHNTAGLPTAPFEVDIPVQ